MLAPRCLMLNSYLIDRYFSVHLMTNIGHVKLSTNLVYGRNGLWTDSQSRLCCAIATIPLSKVKKKLGIIMHCNISIKKWCLFSSRIWGRKSKKYGGGNKKNLNYLQPWFIIISYAACFVSLNCTSNSFKYSSIVKVQFLRLSLFL